MDTRDMLELLRAFAATLHRPARLPDPQPTQRALSALSALPAASSEPNRDILDELRRGLILLAKEGRGYAMVPNRELRHAPWLLWAPQQPLADLPGLLDEIVRRATQRPSLLRPLIEAWIGGFAPDAPTMRAAATAIRAIVSAHRHPAMMALAAIDRRTDLFDVARGPRALAQHIIDAMEPVQEILSESGFGHPQRASSGYLRAVQSEIVSIAGDWLSGPAALRHAERLFEFVAPKGNLRFGDSETTGELARGLLQPWLDGGKGAGSAVEQTVFDFLIRHLGDPRLRPQLWLAAGDAVQALLRKWLTKASMDAFFKLIDAHALDQHWRYRSAFWGAYLKAGAITDAWLAFGSTIFHDARRVKELRGAYGRLDGAQANHAILLMRIGDFVFCDWSHSGKLRAWPANWAVAPKLNAQSYFRNNLIAKCVPFPPSANGRGGNSTGEGLSHMGSENGNWQGSVAELIARRTGIRLTMRDYMPK